MKRLLYLLPTIILICFYGINILAQNSKPKKKQRTRSEREMGWEKGYKNEFSDCEIYNKFTAKQRLTMYPFSKAAKVLAISYKYGGWGDMEDEKLQSPKIGLNIINGLLDTTTLIEQKGLSNKEIDELTNLFFNTDYKKKDVNSITRGACFEPRNALIFLDSNNQVVDYLEICFTCAESRAGSDDLKIGVLCNQKYKMFSDYFKNVGVRYGTLGKKYD